MKRTWAEKKRYNFPNKTTGLFLFMKRVTPFGIREATLILAYYTKCSWNEMSEIKENEKRIK